MGNESENPMEPDTSDTKKVCFPRGTARMVANVSSMKDVEEDEAMQVDDENSDSDLFSDISDNSDIFHVGTDESVPPRTPQDVDLALIDTIASHLRDYPLLPPDVRDPNGERSFKDVASGMRFPLLHCGFKGCSWQCSKREDVKWHWDLENRLSCHLQAVHKDSEMSCLPIDVWRNPHEKKITGWNPTLTTTLPS